MPTFTTLASSSFTGSDENPLSEGGVWTGGTGSESGWKRVSSTAVPNATGSDTSVRYTGITFATNQFSRAQLTMAGTTQDSGVALIVNRSNSAGANRYEYVFIINHGATNNASVYRVVNGAFTLLGSRWTQAFTDGDQFAIGVENEVIFVYDKNTTQIFTISDVGGGVLTPGSPGLAGSSSFTSGSADNWDGGTFASANPATSGRTPYIRMVR